MTNIERGHARGSKFDAIATRLIVAGMLVFVFWQFGHHLVRITMPAYRAMIG